MKYPWMPMFWGDFLANTMHLSAQEVGAYVLLICHAWEHQAKIPLADAQRIARVNNRHWQKIWSKLSGFFEPLDGLQGHTLEVRHPRVATELAIAAETSNKRKGAALQMHANRRARVEQVHPPHTTPLIESSNGKVRENENLQMHGSNFRDKGPDYRAPPSAKSDNVLEPVPDRPKSQAQPDETKQPTDNKPDEMTLAEVNQRMGWAR